jgi:hypothetical protein
MRWCAYNYQARIEKRRHICAMYECLHGTAHTLPVLHKGNSWVLRIPLWGAQATEYIVTKTPHIGKTLHWHHWWLTVTLHWTSPMWCLEGHLAPHWSNVWGGFVSCVVEVDRWCACFTMQRQLVSFVRRTHRSSSIDGENMDDKWWTATRDVLEIHSLGTHKRRRTTTNLEQWTVTKYSFPILFPSHDSTRNCHMAPRHHVSFPIAHPSIDLFAFCESFHRSLLATSSSEPSACFFTFSLHFLHILRTEQPRCNL